MKETLSEQLIRHEGLKLKAYRCSKGKWTIGVGRNIQDRDLLSDEKIMLFGQDAALDRNTIIAMLRQRGITKDEAMTLLRNDISLCMSECRGNFPFFDSLTEDRQNVLLNMVFNMGIIRVKGFKRMIQALKDQDYEAAAREMLGSQWAVDVGDRATELAKQMREG